MIATPDLNLEVVAPIGFTAIGAMLVLLGEVLLSRRETFLGRQVTESLIGSLLGLTAIFWLALACFVALSAFVSGTSEVFNPDNPLLRLDPFSALISALIALSALLACWLAIAYLAELRINHGEFYALVMLAASGMMLMVAAVDLITVFLGLELMSIPIYVLAGFDRRKLRSNESSLKYFLIGSFASAILLYGMALLYGASGSTSLEALRAGFTMESPLALMGLGLLLVGFAFKISAVPFHQWTPDVYEGAPAVVTAFMAVSVKAAAFATLLRILALGIGPLDVTIINVLWVLAALTMVVGNVMALIQENIKRLLAYSSIGHAGYLLIGLVAATPASYSAVVFYLIAYTFTNLGAFGVIVALAQRGQDCEKLEDLAGLARARPGLAALMALFMISLIGIPGTAGFFAKFYIFMAAVDAGFISLTLIGVLTSAISVYYYLRIPVLMYMRDPREVAPRADLASGEAIVLVVCAVGVLLLGIFPNNSVLPVLDWARESVGLFFTPGAVPDSVASLGASPLP